MRWPVQVSGRVVRGNNTGTGIARNRGASIAVINTETTALDELADWRWQAPASVFDMLL